MEFSLNNVIDNQQVSLSSYRDKTAVAVIFSCNHCPYVIAYEERMKALHQTYAAKGVPVIAISSNDVARYPQDAPEQMKLRALEKEFPFPYLFDESQEVARAFKAERTPQVFLIKYEQETWKVLYNGAIDDNWAHPDQVTISYAADCIDALLAEKVLPYEKMPAVGCTIKWKG